MDEQYRIERNDDPDDAAVTAVGMGVHNFNIAQAGEMGYKRLCFFLHGPEDEVAGGLVGSVFWNWFYLDLVWVREDLRGQGYGRQLVEQAEVAARQLGARHAYLDTFSFQAPGFYDKLGYHVFGELPDFPEGQQRFFYAKALA